MSVVLVEVADQIGTITLNRPEARNAISGQLTRELDEAVTNLDGREDVGYHLWGLLILLLWANRWNIDFSPVQQHEEIYKGLSVH